MKVFFKVNILLLFVITAYSNGFGETLQQTIDPNKVYEKLLKGNERFSEGVAVHPHQDIETRTKTSNEGQKPMVTILSCSDSRVPPEEIFDLGVGDIFTVRVAGNIADRSVIGSLEYGLEHLGTPLLVVLGHTKCGAVTAAVENSETNGNITYIVNKIKPAVSGIKSQSKDFSKDDLITNAVKANIWQTIEDILTSSSQIRKFVKEGKVKVVGAIYDIQSGVVTDLGVHYRQEQIMRGAEK